MVRDAHVRDWSTRDDLGIVGELIGEVIVALSSVLLVVWVVGKGQGEGIGASNDFDLADDGRFQSSSVSWEELAELHSHDLVLFGFLGNHGRVSSSYSILIIFLSFLLLGDLCVDCPVIDHDLEL